VSAVYTGAYIEGHIRGGYIELDNNERKVKIVVVRYIKMMYDRV